MSNIFDKLLCIKNNSKFGIIMSKEKYDYLQSRMTFKDDYSITLIHVILNEYFFNLVKIFKSDNTNVEIFIKDSFSIDNYILDTKINFIMKLEKLCNEGIFNQEDRKKTLYLKSLIQIERLLDSKSFEYYYEQQKREIQTEKIIKFLNNEPNMFKNLIDNFDSNKKDELLIVLVSFIKKVNKNSYIMPDNMRENIKYILKIGYAYEITDKIQLKKRPHYLKKAKLNKEFIKKIIDSIPTSFSDYEKALYVYIYLCNHLTHDERDVNKCNMNINHKNIHRIEEIDENNNIVVCYEFATIYALIMDILNIKYEMLGDSKYGRGHILLCIVYKDSKIHVEATYGLFECDLTRTKNNIRVQGFMVEKSNPKTQEEIDLSYEKVYDYIEKETQKKYYCESELVKKKRLENKYENLDFDKKLKVFYSEICCQNLPPVDKIKYIRLLKKIIFGKSKDINMCLIMNDFKISIIFTTIINDEYKYYLYNYPDSIVEIEKSQIEYGFKIGFYELVNCVLSDIPGIEIKKELLKKY